MDITTDEMLSKCGEEDGKAEESAQGVEPANPVGHVAHHVDAAKRAALTCLIAEAFYGGVPGEIVDEVKRRLDPDLWGIAEAFGRKYVLAR